MDGMQNGLYAYLCRPDLMNSEGPEGQYREQMRQLCREAKGCGIPLELNMLGSWSGRHYPTLRFWELAAEEGCDVILGCDAHAPDHLLKQETEEKLCAMAADLGLNLLETLPLRNIK